MHAVLRNELLRHGGLLGVIRGTERDVMHRAASLTPALAFGLTNVDHRAQPRAGGAVTHDRSLASGFAESEHVGEDRAGPRGVVEKERHAVKAADRMLCRDIAVAPAGLGLGLGHA